MSNSSSLGLKNYSPELTTPQKMNLIPNFTFQSCINRYCRSMKILFDLPTMQIQGALRKAAGRPAQPWRVALKE
jgi:hypothetical protein